MDGGAAAARRLTVDARLRTLVRRADPGAPPCFPACPCPAVIHSALGLAAIVQPYSCVPPPGAVGRTKHNGHGSIGLLLYISRSRTVYAHGAKRRSSSALVRAHSDRSCLARPRHNLRRCWCGHRRHRCARL